MMRFAPSLLAAALIASARSAASEEQGLTWDACMEKHTGYSEAEVLPVMKEMRSKLQLGGLCKEVEHGHDDNL
jgi:hypothetical protein